MLQTQKYQRSSATYKSNLAAFVTSHWERPLAFLIRMTRENFRGNWQLWITEYIGRGGLWHWHHRMLRCHGMYSIPCLSRRGKRWGAFYCWNGSKCEFDSVLLTKRASLNLGFVASIIKIFASDWGDSILYPSFIC